MLQNHFIVSIVILQPIAFHCSTQAYCMRLLAIALSFEGITLFDLFCNEIAPVYIECLRIHARFECCTIYVKNTAVFFVNCKTYMSTSSMAWVMFWSCPSQKPFCFSISWSLTRSSLYQQNSRTYIQNCRGNLRL